MKHIPFAAKWTIKESVLKKLKDTENGYLVTKYISTKSSSIKYYFMIYPNGYDEENRGKVVILLGTNRGDFRNVEAKYTVKVESASYCSKELKNDYDESTALGWLYWDTVDLFDPEKKFIFDGKMVLKIDGIFEFESDDENCYDDYTYVGGIGDKIWQKESGQDFLVIAADDGRGVKIHKFFLASKSTIFSEMFKSNPDQDQIIIPDFTFEVIEIAMKMVYDCDVGNVLTIWTGLSLLEFFDKYKFTELKDHYEELIIDENICAFTVCRITNCSIKFNALKLQQKCEKFLMDSVTSKMPMTDFDMLDKNILLKIFQNNFYKDVETD